MDEKQRDAALALQRQYMGSKGGSSFGGGQDQMTGMHSSVISYNEQKRRRRGEPVIIQRQIFFDGVVYQIEEELYSDSDHSSVYTSEDDFKVDKNIQRRFREVNPLLSDQDSVVSATGNLLKKFTNQLKKGDGKTETIKEQEEAQTPITPRRDSQSKGSSSKASKEGSEGGKKNDKTPERRGSVSKNVTIKEEKKEGTPAPQLKKQGSIKVPDPKQQPKKQTKSFSKEK